MNVVIYRKTLDFQKFGCQFTINAKKGDTLSGKLVLSFAEKGKPFFVEDGTTVILYGKKPDGETLTNECTVKNGAIEYCFTSQTLSAPGILHCELKLIKKNGDSLSTLASPQFEVEIEDNIQTDSAVVSTNEYTLLESKIAQVDILSEKAGTAATRAETAAAAAEKVTAPAKEAAENAITAAENASSAAEAADEKLKELQKQDENLSETLANAQAATESAQGAAEEAREEAQNAKEATTVTFNVALNANTAATAAGNACVSANRAAAEAVGATEDALQAAENANTAAENATAAAQAAETAKQGAETATENANTAAQAAISAVEEAKEISSFYGSPLIAATAAAMTNTKRVYVYTGTETGYIKGNWYYHNGSGWVNGGVYNSTIGDGCMITDTNNNKSYFMKFRITNGKPVIVYEEV